MNNKISLIVPVYNSEKTIRKCVESVLNQTYKNFEVIFVNDGGTDKTVDILKEYKANDDRIIIVEKEYNSGVSSTRNFGLRYAKGDFIQFLDSDDYLELNMFERMIEEQIKYNADLVVCNYNHPSIKNYLGDCVLNLKKKADLLKYVQTTFSMVVPWNKLYRRSVLINIFDETVHFCEDDLFALSNLKKIKTVVSISDKLYNYYVAPADTSIEESSCINKMAKAEDFYKTKNTYWYNRRNLLKKSLKFLRRHLDNETALDCAYARMFDFMIWELLIMDQIGVNRRGLTIEMQNIFKEDEFMFSLELRNKYGLYFNTLENDELNEMVELFCKRCFEISEVSSQNPNFKAFYACLYLFIEMFMSADDFVDSVDMMGKAYNELINNETLEARYVNYHYSNRADGETESIYNFCS